MQKIAVLVLADMDESHEAMGRITNALSVVQEFQEAGDEVKLIFDGAGTASLANIADPEHQMHGRYEMVKESVVGACAFCAKAFDVKDKLQKLNVPLLDEYKQHPSIHSFVSDGYQIVTF